MKMNTYINFRGTCAEAFRYYEKHLAAKMGMVMTHGQVPDPGRVNPDWKDKVVHAHFDRRHRTDGGGYPQRRAYAERIPHTEGRQRPRGRAGLCRPV